MSNLEKVQVLGSFFSFSSHSVPFLPHRPATLKRSNGRQRDKTAHVHMGLGVLMCYGRTD